MYGYKSVRQSGTVVFALKLATRWLSAYLVRVSLGTRVSVVGLREFVDVCFAQRTVCKVHEIPF